MSARSRSKEELHEDPKENELEEFEVKKTAKNVNTSKLIELANQIREAQNNILNFESSKSPIICDDNEVHEDSEPLSTEYPNFEEIDPKTHVSDYIKIVEKTPVDLAKSEEWTDSFDKKFDDIVKLQQVQNYELSEEMKLIRDRLGMNFLETMIRESFKYNDKECCDPLFDSLRYIVKKTQYVPFSNSKKNTKKLKARIDEHKRKASKLLEKLSSRYKQHSDRLYTSQIIQLQTYFDLSRQHVENIKVAKVNVFEPDSMFREE